MTGQARKRSTLVVIVIVIAILTGAIVIQFQRMAGPSVQSSSAILSSSSPFSSSSSTSLTQSKATSYSSSLSLSSSSTSLTQSKATASSSSGSQGSELMSIGLGGRPYKELVATPSATMNYSITIGLIDPRISQVTLSAVSMVPGVTTMFNPKNLTFQGLGSEVVVLRISVDSSVSSSDLPIKLVANTSQGAASTVFSFTLEKGLIVVESLGSGGLAKPATLHVGVGQSVKWLDLTPIDDDGNGYTNIQITASSYASPRMEQFDIWSHSFDKPGTYTYSVAMLGYPSSSGVVVVE